MGENKNSHQINVQFSKLVIASDHAGIEFKAGLLAHWQTYYAPLPWNDLGPIKAESVDYPDYAHLLAQNLLSKDSSALVKPVLGILICGSGIGMSMVANRHEHVRAALLQETVSASLTRKHNDANVICLGARLLGLGMATEIMDVFINTAFEGGRHQKRIEKMTLH